MRPAERAAIAAAVALPACAATITDHRIGIEVSGDDAVESESIRVRLEEQGDLDAWRVYLVNMEADDEILDATARVLDLDGREVGDVPRRSHQRIESPGYDLYNSSWIDVIPFPPLSVGQTIAVDLRIKKKPRYPSTGIPLAAPCRQTKLTVKVDAPGKKLRHRLRDPDGTMHVKEGPGSLSLEATDVPASQDAPLGPSAAGLSILRVAWDGDATWESVAAWYRRFAALPATPDPAVAARAKEITKGMEGPRDRVDALARFVKQDVRYEAVEIGAGGWVPHAASETLARRWGDCKDKAELLRQMAAAIGIEGQLVLLHAGAELEVDPEFPTPDTFNHCILALPAKAAGATSDDPVVDGKLLVDATVVRGGIGWLSAADQGDWALLTGNDGGRLVRIPDLAGSEERDLSIEGAVGPDGVVDASVKLAIAGGQAVPWIERMARDAPSSVEASIRTLLGEIFPAATFDRLDVREVLGAAPKVELSAHALLLDPLRGEPPDRWLPAPALTAMPGPRLFDDRKVPVVLQVGTSRTRIVLRLPGCAPSPVDETVDTAAGRVHQRVSAAPDGATVIEREVAITRSRIGVDELAEASRLAVAESRADKRRVGLHCSGGGS
ncbi:MAG: transglutaminase family protein [Acidobacteriota bacterium]